MPKNPTRPWPAKGPAAPHSHVPLEPIPLFLSGEGVLDLFYQGPKGVFQGPSTPGAPPPRLGLQPPVHFLVSELQCTWALSLSLLPPSLNHTTVLRGLSLTGVRLWLPVSWLSWGESSDRCPGWGGGRPQSVPTCEVPTAHHVPGLGLPPLQLPVPQGSSLSPSQTTGEGCVVPEGAHRRSPLWPIDSSWA